MLGMGLALCVTIFGLVTDNQFLLIAGMVVGGVIGWVLAKRV